MILLLKIYIDQSILITYYMSKKPPLQEGSKPSPGPFPMTLEHTQYVNYTESDRHFLKGHLPPFPSRLDQSELVACNDSDLFTLSQMEDYLEKRKNYPKKAVLEEQLNRHEDRIEEIFKQVKLKSKEEVRFKPGEINKKK